MSRFEELSEKYASAANRHDAQAVAAFYANDCVIYGPLFPEPLRGRDAAQKDIADFIRAFPDLRFEFRNALEKGDVGVAELHMSGTNTGPLSTPIGEVPATKKRIDIWGAGYARINSQGLIAEERRYYDTAGFMKRLGLAPEPAMAGAAR